MVEVGAFPARAQGRLSGCRRHRPPYPVSV